MSFDVGEVTERLENELCSFVSSMFVLSVKEVDSQPNVISQYGQAYISQEVYVPGPMFIGLFFLFWWVLSPLKIFDTF